MGHAPPQCSLALCGVAPSTLATQMESAEALTPRTRRIKTHSRKKEIMGVSSIDKKLLLTIQALRRRELRGACVCAKTTAEIIQLIVRATRWTTAAEVLDSIRKVGLVLTEANPTELSIGNIVRRALWIIREEYISHENALKKRATEEAGSFPLTRSISTEKDLIAAPSLYKMMDSDEEEHFSEPYDIKNDILIALGELHEELGNLYHNISAQATQHIHAKEVVMTMGQSSTVVEFLKAAARKRKFQVVVAEAAPSYVGRVQAKALANSGIETTLITDAAVFALMSRVNKVIVGTHAVMANGGLIAHAGVHAMALAASVHKVPFVVLTGLYKLCPLYPYDDDTFNDLNSPSTVLTFEAADDVEHVSVSNPAYDYVPPELVSLFITNSGGHNPSYIYRLLSEYYHPSDYTLED